MTLKAILFDAGNTLVFLDYPRLAAEVGAAVGVRITGAHLVAQAGPAALALERGESSDHERATAYLEMLFLLAGVPEAALPVVRDTLLTLHRERHLWGGTEPGTGSTLDRLRAAGYRLAVVSNSDGRAEEALNAAQILDRFEFVVDSALVGFEKPDPRIFRYALRRLGIAPSEALYVGDIYEVDVIGARRAGMEVVLLDQLGIHAGKDVVSAQSLAELAERVLKGWSGDGR